MDIIRKDKYNIIYNHYNEHIPADFGLYSSEDDDDMDHNFNGANAIKAASGNNGEGVETATGHGG